MTRETRHEYLSKKQRRESWDTLKGFVTKVHEKELPPATEDRVHNHQVNVQLAHRDEELKNVPIHTTHKGDIYVPQKNDAVEIGFIKGMSQRPFVASFIHTNEIRAPLGRAGHFRRKFEYDEQDRNRVFFEAEPFDHSAGDPDVVRWCRKTTGVSDRTIGLEMETRRDIVRMVQNSDPQSDPNDELRIEVNGESDGTAFIEGDPNDDGTGDLYIGVENGGETAYMQIIKQNGKSSKITLNRGSGNIDINVDEGDITINTKDGDVSASTDNGSVDVLSKNGSVKVGEQGGTFKPVARKGDNVEVDDPDSGTLSGEITAGSSDVSSS